MTTTTTWTCWRDPAHDQIAFHDTFGWPQCMVCRAAPPYHERTEYLDERLNLTLYVPVHGGFIERIAAPRSAVEGLPAGDERAVVYIEGWINGPMQYADSDVRGLWEAGVEHAASRMDTAYPTASCFSPSLDALDAIRGLADAGVATFEVTAIDRDGLLQGPDLELLGNAVALDRGRIIASAGISSIEDIVAVRSIGCAGAIVGRALYEGQLSLRDALSEAAAR